MKASTQKIAPCLTFNDQAEEAANFYVSIFSAVFENSKILNIARFSKEELEALSYLPEDIRPGPAGSVRTIRFLLNGQEIEAVNGGNFFNFCEGMSLYVRCEDQKEIDWLWEKLSEGGEKSQCGWLKDKYGVSCRSHLPL
ncbi:VOC family protein [Methanosarcina horonobensis]|uniref:VOC family protein n=1 Tax=Methanosarcina horonobensis TaxID=418008 RepID=UPI000B256461|nr:VOC family protein [Methanosarcina horonobensis]